MDRHPQADAEAELPEAAASAIEGANPEVLSATSTTIEATAATATASASVTTTTTTTQRKKHQRSAVDDPALDSPDEAEAGAGAGNQRSSKRQKLADVDDDGVSRTASTQASTSSAVSVATVEAAASSSVQAPGVAAEAVRVEDAAEAAEEARVEQTCALLSLSDEMLLAILRCLDGASLDAVAGTCHRLRTICADSSLWTSFDYLLKPLTASQLKRRYHHLHSRTHTFRARGRIQCYPARNYNNCTVTLPMLSRLRTVCPQLREFRLDWAYMDTSEPIDIFSFPPTLHSLTLRNIHSPNPGLTRSFFTRIDTHLQHLHTIRFEYCSWFHTHNLIVFSKMEHLRHLSLRGCMSMRDCVPYGSVSTRFGFQRLHTLDLRETPVQDSDIQCFNITGSLRELHLSAPHAKSHWGMRREAQKRRQREVRERRRRLPSAAAPAPPSSSSSSSSSAPSSSSSASSSSSTSASSSPVPVVGAPARAPAASRSAAQLIAELNGAARRAEALGSHPRLHQLAVAADAIVDAAAAAAGDGVSREDCVLRMLRLVRSNAAGAPVAADAAMLQQAIRDASEQAEAAHAEVSEALRAAERDAAAAGVMVARVADAEAAVAAAAEAAADDLAVDSGTDSDDSDVDDDDDSDDDGDGDADDLQERLRLRERNAMLELRADYQRMMHMVVEDRRRRRQAEPEEPAVNQQVIVVRGVGDPGYINEFREGQHGNIRRYPDNGYQWEVINQPLAANAAEPADAADAAAAAVAAAAAAPPNAANAAADEAERLYHVNRQFGVGRPDREALISDRGICAFGESSSNMRQRLVWIRYEMRPRETLLERITMRNYPLVSDTTLQHLAEAAPHLRWLDVRGTAVTADGALAFRAARPLCELLTSLDRKPGESAPVPTDDEEGDFRPYDTAFHCTNSGSDSD